MHLILILYVNRPAGYSWIQDIWLFSFPIANLWSSNMNYLSMRVHCQKSSRQTGHKIGEGGSLGFQGRHLDQDLKRIFVRIWIAGYRKKNSAATGRKKIWISKYCFTSKDDNNINKQINKCLFYFANIGLLRTCITSKIFKLLNNCSHI